MWIKLGDYILTRDKYQYLLGKQQTTSVKQRDGSFKDTELLKDATSHRDIDQVLNKLKELHLSESEATTLKALQSDVTAIRRMIADIAKELDVYR